MEVLGMKHLRVTDNFFDLGGHSLSGLRLINRLRDALGQRLVLGLIFEAPTPRQMAAFLEQKFPAAVTAWVEETMNAEPTAAADGPSGSLASVIPIDRESRRVSWP
jgi:hypothetical protein